MKDANLKTIEDLLKYYNVQSLNELNENMIIIGEKHMVLIREDYDKADDRCMSQSFKRQAYKRQHGTEMPWTSISYDLMCKNRRRTLIANLYKIVED